MKALHLALFGFCYLLVDAIEYFRIVSLFDDPNEQFCIETNLDASPYLIDFKPCTIPEDEKQEFYIDHRSYIINKQMGGEYCLTRGRSITSIDNNELLVLKLCAEGGENPQDNLFFSSFSGALLVGTTKNDKLAVTLHRDESQPGRHIELLQWDHTNSGQKWTFHKTLSSIDVLGLLFNSAGGGQWVHNTNWATGLDECTWHGITCTDGEISHIDLANNNLRGTIPSEIGLLPKLTHLYLEYNTLTGSIPGELRYSTELRHINLEHNNLTGPIPGDLGQLTKLRKIWLSFNTLSSTIPSEIGNLARLNHLSLQNNLIDGHIPSELGLMTKLRWVKLYYNGLYGPIPSEIGLLTELEELGLKNNILSGSIPNEIGSLEKLQLIWLDNNMLEGSIPSDIGQLADLLEIHLSNNMISGSIPTSIGNLSELHELILEVNGLTGLIPGEIGQLNQLEKLWLARNNLDGPIPNEVCNLNHLSLIVDTNIICQDNALN